MIRLFIRHANADHNPGLPAAALAALSTPGRYIFVFRDLDLVVAVTSSTTASDERWGYRRRLFDLLGSHVLPRFD